LSAGAGRCGKTGPKRSPDRADAPPPGCDTPAEAGTSFTAPHRFTIIKNKTADMGHIVEQLFLFSRLDVDEFPLTLRRIPLMLVITDMVEEVSQEYYQRGLSIFCLT
jgi:signal transduction histidine kinase